VAHLAPLHKQRPRIFLEQLDAIGGTTGRGQQQSNKDNMFGDRHDLSGTGLPGLNVN
jgi:hypothetical protein